MRCQHNLQPNLRRQNQVSQKIIFSLTKLPKPPQTISSGWPQHQTEPKQSFNMRSDERRVGKEGGWGGLRRTSPTFILRIGWGKTGRSRSSSGWCETDILTLLIFKHDSNVISGASDPGDWGFAVGNFFLFFFFFEANGLWVPLLFTGPFYDVT